MQPNKTDNTLTPLFQTPKQWFRTLSYEYEMFTGNNGRVQSLSPTEIIFKHAKRRTTYLEASIEANKYRETINDEDSITLVTNQDNIGENQTRCGWIKVKGRMITTFEYISFPEAITTPDELRTQLNKILQTEPNFQNMFDRLEQIPQENK